MRKKSHISLARYIVSSLDEKELMKHKKAFYLGNILPDCKPTFLTTKHEFGGTFDKVKKDIVKLTIANESNINNNRAYWRDLGQVIHYIADYFTFPHNKNYDGSLKDHCIYENHLKLGLRKYINSGEAQKNLGTLIKFESLDALFIYIREVHEEYLKFKRSVQEDCKYIVNLSQQVVQTIIYLFEKEVKSMKIPCFA
ncbi:MAG: zinc dependent phospholipase C family protein [Lachnotalea sp.]